MKIKSRPPSQLLRYIVSRTRTIHSFTKLSLFTDWLIFLNAKCLPNLFLAMFFFSLKINLSSSSTLHYIIYVITKISYKWCARDYLLIDRFLCFYDLKSMIFVWKKKIKNWREIDDFLFVVVACRPGLLFIWFFAATRGGVETSEYANWIELKKVWTQLLQSKVNN